MPRQGGVALGEVPAAPAAEKEIGPLEEIRRCLRGQDAAGTLERLREQRVRLEAERRKLEQMEFGKVPGGQTARFPLHKIFLPKWQIPS